MTTPNPYQEPIDADGDSSVKASGNPGWLWFFFSADGRIGRGDYVFGMGMIILLYVLATLAVDFFFGSLVSENPRINSAWLYVAPLLPFFWSWFVLHVKRLHDRGKSGSWICVAFVPYFGGPWLLFECALLEGKRGANRFGGRPQTPWQGP